MLKTPLQHDQLSEIKEDQHHPKKHDLSSVTEHSGKLEERLISYPNPPLHNHVSKIKIKPEAGRETAAYPVIEFRGDGATSITISEITKYDKSIVVISSSDRSTDPALTVVSETSYGQSPAVGTGSLFARQDHTHGTPAAISPALTVVSETSYGQAAAVGTGSLYARQDHTHGTPASDAISPATTVMGEVTYGLSPVVGTGSLYARHDHTHGTPSAISVPSAAVSVVEETTYGKIPAVGTGSEYAKNDHTHGSVPEHGQTIYTPVGLSAADNMLRIWIGYPAYTTETDQEARVVYLGRVGKVFSTATVAINVMVAAVDLSWAEMGICTGTPTTGAVASFTLIGYTDVKATIQAAGVTTVTINLTTNTAIGDHIWFIWAQKKNAQGSLASFTPCSADRVTCGIYQYRTNTQPSAMAAPTTFSLYNITVSNPEPQWVVVGMT